MSSRFTDTELWNEDWFCEMPGEYQLFLKYVFDKCDNAGVWKPNKFDFETKTKFKVSPDLLFKKVNVGQQRVLLLENGRWFFTGYILFQWFNKKKSFDLVLSNRLHKSLFDIIESNKIPLNSVRGLREVLKTPMVMEVVVGGIDGIPAPKTDTQSDSSIVFSIEHCMEIALRDERFVKTNKTSESELKIFNETLEKAGEYERNPADYKRHFSKWKPLNLEKLKTNGSTLSKAVAALKNQR